MRMLRSTEDGRSRLNRARPISDTATTIIGHAMKKADDVVQAMGKFLCGEKPATREEADALKRAMDLVLWEASVPRKPRSRGWLSWLRLRRQRSQA